MCAVVRPARLGQRHASTRLRLSAAFAGFFLAFRGLKLRSSVARFCTVVGEKAGNPLNEFELRLRKRRVRGSRILAKFPERAAGGTQQKK